MKTETAEIKITDQQAMDFLEEAGLSVIPENVAMVQLLLADALSNGCPPRRHLIKHVRAEIADSAYETPEKLEVAVDRLLEELLEPELYEKD
jgi:hypothetical protein